MAHELRQPLAIIGGFARRMHKQVQESKEIDAATQANGFTVIMTEIQRLEKILDSLIDFTKQKTLVRRRANPNTLIEEVLHFYQERIQEKELRLELNFGEEIGEVMLDTGRFQQIVRNLLSNAIDASRHHGIISIETGVFIASEKAQETGALESEAFFEFKIRNGGKTIPPGELRKIFAPFYTTKGHGVGIGLAVVKRIVEQHRGSVSVKSDEKGTVFTIWIPLQLQESDLESDKTSIEPWARHTNCLGLE